jgi:AhpD family alkylhydroperoxidase
MPRVPVHTLEDAPEDSRETLEALAKRSGKLLNIFAEMAHAPVLLQMHANTERLLREASSLEEPERKALHLTVANVNGCDYCQAAYTGAARALGYSEADTLAIRRGELPDDQRLTAALKLAREIAANTGSVEDATWDAALARGWSESELLEVFAEVMRTTLTNYFNHLVGTELDLPEAPELS